MISQEDNLIIQSYVTVSLLAELGNNKFFQSDCFNKMIFGSPDVKRVLSHMGVDNQGCAVMCLYALLVVPYELIRNKYPNDFSSMNSFLGNKTQNTTTTYNSDKPTIDFMYHIRNAVAHCRLNFKEGVSVTFTDSKNKSQKFSTELPFRNLNEFIDQLQRVIQMKVIKDLQSTGKN